MEFKGGDVAEWYLTGELVCPFALQQLPDTDVHHTMNNTFIVLGWVSFSHTGSFASLPFNGSTKQWKVPKNEESHKVRMLVLPLQSSAIQAYIGATSYGRIVPSVFYNDAYADIKVLDIRHDDEGSPADSVQWMYEPPTAVPIRTMNRAQVFAQGVYVGLTESVNAMKNSSEVPTILRVKASGDQILTCSRSVEAAAAAALLALSSGSNVSKTGEKS